MDTTKKRKNRWGTAALTRKSVQAIELLVRYAALLVAVFDEAWRGTFATDADALRTAQARVEVARAELKSATADVIDVGRGVRALLMGVRKLVRYGRPPDRTAWGAFGIGRTVHVREVAGLIAGLDTAVDAAEGQPEVAAELGIGADMVTALRDARAALVRADSLQEERKSALGAAVAERNALQARVETSLGRIIGHAAVIFRAQPEIAAQFAALLPERRAGRRETAETAAEPSVTPVGPTPVEEAA